ncbi:unnamed protein product [Paramecium pentaurelia]|uniref:Uncharacterized protein n=1 Tax=Paramecium pentaurelia TaxID=43138 RepID=A0A8S1URI1_9CILI|nr:unnamed protein product [Paramecium pentaurelia]
MQVESQVVYKFILLEYPSVGKTAFNINSFNEQYQPTIGVDFHSIKFDSNSKALNFIKGVVIIGDVTNRQSFNDLSKWQEKVIFKEGQQLANTSGMLFIGTLLKITQKSAKEGINIDQAMKNFLNEALAQNEKYKKEDHSKNQ